MPSTTKACWWCTASAPDAAATNPEIPKAVNFARVTLTPKAWTLASFSRRAISTLPVRLRRIPATSRNVTAMATRLTWYMAKELVQTMRPRIGRRSIRPVGSQSKKRGFSR